LLVVAAMFGSMVMAVALPNAFSTRGLVFAGAYVVTQLGAQLFLVIVLRGHRRRRVAVRTLFWFAISAVPWIAGAFVHHLWRGLLWSLALAIDYVSAFFGWPTPRLGRARTADWTIAGEHLAERYQQFLLIVLGESILITGFSYSASNFEAARNVAFFVAFATTVLLWRIYFHRAGELLAAAIRIASRPAGLAVAAGFAHLLMIAGIVATAVGYQVVIDRPVGTAQPEWAVVFFGGPLLFMVGRGWFERTVFNRISWTRPVGVLALAATAPLVFVLPPLGLLIVAAVVLVVVGVGDAARSRGRPPEEPSPPR
jgi:low temperature requirement protein LtrA